MTAQTYIPKPAIKSQSTKDLIIKILANEWPLTAKKIFNEVVKESKSAISYQAVHKTLSQLIEEGIASKVNDGYQLNIEWIKNLERLSDTLNKSYASNQKHSFEELWKKEYVTLTFPNVIELGRFLILNYGNYPNPEKKACIFNIRFAYSTIGISEEETKELRKVFGQCKWYALVHHDTPIDRFFGTGVEKMGVKSKFGIPCAFNCDAIVVGDYVCNIYWPQKHWKEWEERNKRVKSIKELDLENLLYIMHNHPTKTKVIVYKDAEAAEQIRQNTLKYFEGATK